MGMRLDPAPRFPHRPPASRLALAPVVALLAAASPPAVRAGPTADGAWLDAVPLAQWNAPGAKVPRPPAPSFDPPTVARCATQLRRPASPAEQAVADAGWSLVAPTVRGGAVEVVLGASGVDGMCRPSPYQLFAFSGGRLAGTLAPRPMDARTDGAVDLPVVDDRGGVEAGFRRYAPSDPLCCPSRTSTVTFRVETRPEGPVLGAGPVRTARNEVPGAAPPPAPVHARDAAGGSCGPPAAATGPSWTAPAPAGCDPAAAAAGCAATGGTVQTTPCCGSVGDFPNTCRVGACGCAPSASHPVRTCRCPEGRCFDGASCVDRPGGPPGF
jgi:hypothetical protein